MKTKWYKHSVQASDFANRSTARNLQTKRFALTERGSAPRAIVRQMTDDGCDLTSVRIRHGGRSGVFLHVFSSNWLEVETSKRFVTTPLVHHAEPSRKRGQFLPTKKGFELSFAALNRSQAVMGFTPNSTSEKHFVS